MGCPWSSPSRNQEHVSMVSLPSIDLSLHHSSTPPPDRTVETRLPPPRPPRSSPSPSPPTAQSRVQLYIPIYVALQSNVSQSTDELSFEDEDEFKLIEDNKSNRLYLQHLRSGLTGYVSKSLVRLDLQSPLRLAINDRGVINRCLEHYNKQGSYLIRSNRFKTTDFVLSIDQRNEQRRALHWHYLICLDPETNSFYFRDEQRLFHLRFTSFHHLVDNEQVRATIPLTNILPYAIDFEEELWKIPFDRLTIGERIGGGHFGDVYRAQWNRDTHVREVAVKKIRFHGVTDVVTREIEAMKTLTNLYIVSLLGIATDLQSNETVLVTEFMENGDLKSWLKNLAQLPEHSTILKFARQIDQGMAYLETCNYVHRDLACRNILVASNGNTVKIADFGLSTIVNDRDAERRRKAQEEKIALRWSAPEVLGDGAAYSIKSDVWSFGIVLIEIWLKGEDPYGDATPYYIDSLVKSGHVHEKPALCPEGFYRSIICQCLRFEAADRPSFEGLRQLLNQWQFD